VESTETDVSASMPYIAARAADHLLLRRWIGCWIDLVVVAACLLVPDSVLGNERYQSTIVVWLLLPVAYFVVGELAWGRTLGKLVTGTVVVNERGGRPGIGQVLARTVARVIEVNPLLMGGVPAGIAVAVSSKKQRIGDMIANTYVVSARTLREAREQTVGQAVA
jgi:uncharacterized RDD family membrane protein YckC